MRFCYFCKGPMYTSNNSIWIKGKNYDAHKKCIEEDIIKNSKEIPVCFECGKPMKNSIDPKTKKINEYLWETTCNHFKGQRLCRG